MRTVAGVILVCLFAAPTFYAQDAAGAASPYKAVTDRLQSNVKVPLSGCRSHKDVPHPEDAADFVMEVRENGNAGV